MTKLIYNFEKLDKKTKENQVIEISVEVNSAADIDELSYYDFKIRLFIGKKSFDISPVFYQLPNYEDIIDGIDWEEIYGEMKEDSLIPLENYE